MSRNWLVFVCALLLGACAPTESEHEDESQVSLELTSVGSDLLTHLSSRSYPDEPLDFGGFPGVRIAAVPQGTALLANGNIFDRAQLTIIDANGEIAWARELTGGSPLGLAADAEGNVYITLSFHGLVRLSPTTTEFSALNGNATSVLLAQYRPDGSLGWYRTVSPTNVVASSAVAVDATGSVLVATTELRNGSRFLVLERRSASGVQWWKRSFGGVVGDLDLAIGPGNTIHVLGSYSGDLTVGSTTLSSAPGMSNFVLKMSSTGSLLWARGSANAANDIAVSPSGDVVLAGSRLTGFLEASGFVRRLSPQGDLLWEQLVEGTTGLKSVVIDSFDNALAVGNFYLEGEPTEFVFVTVSASGEPAKTARFMSNSSGVDLVPLDAAASLVRVTGVLGQLFVADPGVSVGGDLLEVEAGGTLFLADYRVNPAAKRFLRGDVDANGVIDVTDPTIVLNYLFSSGPAPSCLDAADANDDGALDLSDGVHLLNYLFEGGEAPVGLPLGPSVDATIDSLTCNALQP